MMKQNTHKIKGKGNKGFFEYIKGKQTRTVLLWAIGVLIVVSALMHVGRAHMRQSPYFKIKHVKCIPRQSYTCTYVKEVMHALHGLNIFTVDLKKTAALLKRYYPQAMEIKVQRCLPDTIVLRINWARPYAQVKLGQYYLVDRQGRFLVYQRQQAFEGIPVIIGAQGLKKESLCKNQNIMYALHLIWILKKIKIVPIAFNQLCIDASHQGYLVFNLANGVEVRSGMQGVVKQMILLAALLKKMSPEEEADIAYIDLRFKDIVVGKKD